jgi:hypothetical protein
MYDMYPATWRVVDDEERVAHYRPQSAPDREEPVQEAMNRRDNGGEPAQ